MVKIIKEKLENKYREAHDIEVEIETLESLLFKFRVVEEELVKEYGNLKTKTFEGYHEGFRKALGLIGVEIDE